MLSVQEEKKALRTRMTEALRNMSPIDRITRSEQLLELLWAEPRFTQSKNIFCYVSMQEETDTHSLIRSCLDEGKIVSVPRVAPESGTIEARSILDWDDDDAWIDGPFGIREPDPNATSLTPPGDIDCVIVPGLAFDEEGYRLGRGKGYYDRFLSSLVRAEPAVRIALAFDLQRVPRVPREPHDQRVDLVLFA